MQQERETELRSEYNKVKWGFYSTSRVKDSVDEKLLIGDIKGQQILAKLAY